MQRLATIAPPQVHEIWALLSQIPDPEIPVLTITDLGMVRNQPGLLCLLSGDTFSAQHHFAG